MRTTTAPQNRGEATRQAILQAAEKVFADVGFAAARLEDVAEMVGIRRPSIVYYFASKQDLYDEVERRIFGELHSAGKARMDAADGPFDKLLAMLDAWLDFLVARPTAAQIIQRLVADTTPRHGNPVEFSSLLLQDIDRIVEDGLALDAFRPITAMQVLNGVASATLSYVCNAQQIGEQRRYDPADAIELAAFRALLHRTARAAVLRTGDPAEA